MVVRIYSFLCDLLLPTFDLLTLLPTYVLGYLHRITYQSIPAHVVHCPFHSRLVLDDINSEACSFCKGTELVIDGFHRDGVKGQKSCLPGSLGAEVL